MCDRTKTFSEEGLKRVTQQWLSLTDYASKYRVSVSTLRRRIKTGSIPYRLDRGRYVVPDEALQWDESSPESLQPTLMSAASPAPLKKHTSETQGVETGMEEPILSSASRLLNELKRAYTSILQEKEEQIIHLKEEVSDLKTLVRVLEDDNERMKRALEIASRS